MIRSVASRRLFGVAGVLILVVTALHAVEPGLPSKSAVWAAAARALGSKNPDPEQRNPDYLAIKFLGPRERRILSDYPMDALDLAYEDAMKQLGNKLPVVTHAFRTKTFDAAMLDALKAGATQVVVLGAGFDSRGYRFTLQLPGVLFMEVDYPPTQEYKKRRVKEILGKPPATVSYVPMDFRRALANTSRRWGRDDRRSAAFLLQRLQLRDNVQVLWSAGCALQSDQSAQRHASEVDHPEPFDF
jgi:methyltransferase (TIGR00027 family)